MKSNNRLYVRDILGATAILLVVFNHSATIFFGWKPNLYGIHSFKIAAISHLFIGIQMPLFVMISGYLYQHLISIGKYINFQKFLKKKIKRLLLPYLILAPLMIILFVPNGANPWVFSVNFFSGTHHLWFILMIFYAFIFFRVLGPYLNDHQITASILLALVSVAGFYLGYIYTGNTFCITPCFKYFFFFFLGTVLYRQPHDLCDSKWWLFALIYLAIRIPHMLFFRNDSFIWINSITPVLEGLFGCLASLGFAGKYGEQIMHFFKIPVNFISRNSYGIYIFHMPFVLWGINVFNHGPQINEYLVVAILFLGSLSFSLAINSLCRRYSTLKLLIGE